jgi:hypothetical protein
MDKIITSEKIDQHRRLFFGAAAVTIAAAQLGMVGSAVAQTKAAQLRPMKPGTNTSFGPAKAGRRRPPQCRLRRSWPRRRPGGPSSARLALRHLQLCRCRAVASVGGLPGDRAISARLWHDTISVQRDGP